MIIWVMIYVGLMGLLTITSYLYLFYSEMNRGKPFENLPEDYFKNLYKKDKKDEYD